VTGDEPPHCGVCGQLIDVTVEHVQCPHQLWHPHGSHQCWRHAGHDGEHRTACKARADLLESDGELSWRTR